VIEGLKPYPAYRAIPNADPVPNHWTVLPLKRAALVNPSSIERRSDDAENLVTFLPMECVGADGRVDARRIVPAQQIPTGFVRFQRGDVLVAKITPCFENGKGACLDSLRTATGFGSTEFIVLRGREGLDNQYLYRFTTTHGFRTAGADSMTGAGGQQRVRPAFVANYPMCLPPVDEQRAIVRFLDYADRRIRKYIAAKRKLIALLEEQKRAIIDRAVTRGLDPNVRLKDSGVPWIGMVPEHWSVRKAKHLFALRAVRSGKAHGKELLSVYTHIGVKPRKELEERGNKASTTDEYWLVEKGDIVVNKLLAWQGAVGMSEYEGVTSPAYDVLRPLADAGSAFFHLLFRTKRMAEEFKVHSTGIMDMRLRLYWEQFGRILLPAPPVEEQRVLVEAVLRRTKHLVTAVASVGREVDLLREYRTRLISDVVTGKLDVREAAARLPDEPEDVPDDAVLIDDDAPEAQEDEDEQ
jgi:type I restriction enzyme S subunit